MHDVLKKSGNNNIVLAVRDRPFERTLTLHKVREDTYLCKRASILNKVKEDTYLYKRASILHKVREDTYLYKRASILHKFRKETPPSQGTLPLSEVREFLQLERGHNPAFTRLDKRLASYRIRKNTLRSEGQSSRV